MGKESAIKPLEPGFEQVFAQHPWAQMGAKLAQIGEAQVKKALSRAGQGSPADFMALVSPAAEPYLEEMAHLAQALTRKRFGKTVQMYLPLYLSNECHNSCLYCGFSKDNPVPRIRLDQKAVEQEIAVLKGMGVCQVLLVTGDFSAKRAVEYLGQALDWITPHFAQVSMEVQPLSQAEYQVLIKKGLHGVMVYQETYGPQYAKFHPHGSKADFFWRLGTADRLGRAGVHKIGLGALLGLDDWRLDSFYTALLVSHLEKHYWQSKLSISFPRLRPAKGGFQPEHPVSDRHLVQLILAYRIFNENLELSLSTRESPDFRDQVIPLGITSISAGSKTEPGGYANPNTQLEQFEIHDARSPQAMEKALAQKGLETLWKDWDPHFGKPQ
ncbi:MAG: thiamine biosynthesis protein ThiH [Candidatus Lambdaproteobacteria bacterium RIFOXYD12_FULL_49_8]|uniref:Thiamine biosynthesis protein ThiH n=1 Tax=Candidatus Lambdaproteobacteria bacterium RIFOXYD2_FULL_50_16 TaxID=1817772 RepID=A0A1F6G4K3_9PROT|nr:MAG: thiamine biosynthesis protein ThiH [Candidatus Lambdaproteobacteria bacterium RIFOXYD2_FULL_50_16]OGG97929.1 MAG: thiamine biosynthesis protein ThiH [Candidatus Lambdaproteobacteria bacterium RIFOXYD12_FULL_49_8]